MVLKLKRTLAALAALVAIAVPAFAGDTLAMYIGAEIQDLLASDEFDCRSAAWTQAI